MGIGAWLFVLWCCADDARGFRFGVFLNEGYAHDVPFGQLFFPEYSSFCCISMKRGTVGTNFGWIVQDSSSGVNPERC